MSHRLKEKMAGEIALSDFPGSTIRKWREIFQISQQDLAKHLDVSPSVISDYESGRRRSPGVSTVKKIVGAFIEMDASTGGNVARQYEFEERSEAVLAMKDFLTGVQATALMKAIDGKCATPEVSLMRTIYGYTLIDSIKAIMSLNASDYLKVFSWSSERALMFTGVHFGRSPMIAIRAHPLKPAMVIYVQPDKVDDLAIRLATLEKIPLVTTELSAQEIVERVESL
ncbi:MAG: helix-turn-helix domain-containing protein [Euryarchaeota archaeon]|nr:helix-turn-helix domain-containing protein [Euryarchaeota archaeon]